MKVFAFVDGYVLTMLKNDLAGKSGLAKARPFLVEQGCGLDLVP